MQRFTASLPLPEEYRRWYYDACALDSSLGVFHEITNLSRRWATIAITSHLALGEAFGNCLRKSKERDNSEILESFWELITSLNNANLIYVVGHDGMQEQYDSVRNSFGRGDVSDFMHLATALKNQCTQFRTTDPDLLGLSKKDLRDIAVKYGLADFCCTHVLRSVAE